MEIIENPTREEALEAQKENIKNIRKQSIKKTFKDSWKNGIDFGSANK